MNTATNTECFVTLIDQDFVDPETEAREDELGAWYGDPRRCRVHGTTTSSRDGLHDGVCGACEAAMDEEDERDTERDADWVDHHAAALNDAE